MRILSDKYLKFSLWLAIFAMLVLALIREIYFFPKPDLIPNPDNSWLLYAASRVADGQKLYVDIMETNPPLIVWLNLLPVWFGRCLNISPFTVFPYLVSFLNIASIYLVAGQLKQNIILSKSTIYNSLLLYISFAFFLLSPALYGQRELLFIALVMPYLFWSLDMDTSFRWYDKKTIIIMASIGFAIKPFFLVLWIVNELHRALQHRKFLIIFAIHNWVIVIAQIIYISAIYLITPDFFTIILPALFETYFSFNSAWEIILKIVGSVVLTVIALFFLTQPHGKIRQIIVRVILWTIACSSFMILQRKDWLNHQYPLVFMAGLATVLMLVYLCELWSELKLDIGYQRFIGLCLAISMVIGVMVVNGRFTYAMLKNSSQISKQLIIAINKYADGKTVYPLVLNMQPSFPAIALSKAVFRGNFHQLWPLAGLIIEEQNEQKMQTRQWFFDRLVHDFSENPPQLVWVDENVNLNKIANYDIEPQNRDLIKFLSHDVRFAILWQNYKKIDEIISEKNEVDTIIKPERFSLYLIKNKE